MARIAAIDMGSNAIRFYVVETAGDSSYRVLENIREPIRLGGDVFLKGTIREENIRKAEAAFRRFRQLLKAHGVQTVRAVATCATREASNADLLLSRLERASGIRVEVISGDEEARLIALAVGKRIPLGKKSALIVDLGGGSVEITFVENGRITLADSHNFGAVRLLDMLSSAEEDLRSAGQLLGEYMDLVGRKLSRRGNGKKAALFIATGGNIESIASIPDVRAEPHPDYPETVCIKAGNLRRLMEELSGMSLKSRMERFGLREDRADVILPACFVYHRIAELNGSEEILVPRVSLKDGVVQEILEQAKGAEHLLDLREQVGVSCREMVARYKLDQKHAEKVTELALSLFDQTEPLHGLGKAGADLPRGGGAPARHRVLHQHAEAPQAQPLHHRQLRNRGADPGGAAHRRRDFALPPEGHAGPGPPGVRGASQEGPGHRVVPRRHPPDRRRAGQGAQLRRSGASNAACRTGRCSCGRSAGSRAAWRRWASPPTRRCSATTSAWT